MPSILKWMLKSVAQEYSRGDKKCGQKLHGLISKLDSEHGNLKFMLYKAEEYGDQKEE